jgi:dinuclear metal center YbgI/SA1388 family protein
VSDAPSSDVSTLRDVATALDELYPPERAEPWDAVGTVCGDPSTAVRSVLFAVDPTHAVVEEAIRGGVDLIVAHHPLFLKPVHSVVADTPKGRVVHRLVSAGIGLHVAHTNADVAEHGVSDALAAAVGVKATRPLRSHGYGTTTGTGRVGQLADPCTLIEFTRRVAQSLPVTAAGIRVAGDPSRMVRTVAVCGGAGDSLFADARAAGADVYLTADLRHHPAVEAMDVVGDAPAPALIDVAHWATEWPWLADAARRLAENLAARNLVVRTVVSHLVTDPWTFHVPGAR